MSRFILDGGPISPTRYRELGYRCDGPRLWRFYATDPHSKPACVGAFYKSKAELLCDLERYASEYGCDGAAPYKCAPVLNANNPVNA